MSKLKSTAKKPIVSKLSVAQFLDVSFPVFNFRHLTTNQNFTFDKFSSNTKYEKGNFTIALLDKLVILSKSTWKDLSLLNKYQGYETIEYSQLNFTATALSLKKDMKVFVFRFASDRARIIGYKSEANPNILFIIGYDFDFSAYNHGS